MTGIAGGHVMLLFVVAFLRTGNQLNLETWFFTVPVLALPATLGFTLFVRMATGTVLYALEAGPSGEAGLLARGLAQAQALPNLLAWLNFTTWLGCTSVGVFRTRPGPAAWTAGDAILQLSFAALFSWGVAFYQRAFHRDTVAPALERLRRWTARGPARRAPLPRPPDAPGLRPPARLHVRALAPLDHRPLPRARRGADRAGERQRRRRPRRRLRRAHRRGGRRRRAGRAGSLAPDGPARAGGRPGGARCARSLGAQRRGAGRGRDPRRERRADARAPRAHHRRAVGGARGAGGERRGAHRRADGRARRARGAPRPR